MRTTTTMAQKRRQTKNKRNPLGRRRGRRGEGKPAVDIPIKVTNSNEKGGKYQACLSKSMYIHMKANKTIRAPR